jgi:ferredoxin hydrogenase small subunit
MARLLWLQAAGCGGCTISLLGSDARDLLATFADAGVDVGWHPSLSEASSGEAIAILRDAASGAAPLDLLCVEGALLRGPRGSGRYQVLSGTGRPMIEWVRALAARARHVVAVGSCAAFGGMTAAGENLPDACGLQYDGEARGGALGADFRSASGLPVVNVAGCPTHPGWVVETLAALALDALAEGDLDGFGRPRSYADQLVHHGCPRNEFYEFKASAEVPSDLGCLMENLGCVGTQAHGDCNTRTWNRFGSCIRGGFACIDCTRPGVPGAGSPLRRDAEDRRHPARAAHRHAEGVVRRPRRALEERDAAAGARQRASGPPGGAAAGEAERVTWRASSWGRSTGWRAISR